MSNVALALDAVTKRLGKIKVIDSLDLAVHAARTLVLLGPTGCGKSTVLRLMMGLLEPDEGQVRIQGTRLRPGNAMRLRQHMGYVIQEGGLFPHLNAADNVVLMARYLKWPRGRIDERLDELTALTRFPRGGLRRFPAELSGGQRQRLALMRALMLDPELLLLDEPLGALDPMVRYGLQEELKELFRRLGKAVVMVTHDLHEAAFFADDAVLLNSGRIEQRGGLQDFLRRPVSEFVQDFVRAQRGLLP